MNRIKLHNMKYFFYWQPCWIMQPGEVVGRFVKNVE